MSREVDGAIRFTGEVIAYVKQFVEEGEDVYEEGATYFNFDKFFRTPTELLDGSDDVVRTAIIHGIAALNPESSFSWGEDYPKFETVELFNQWFDRMFDSSLRKSKKELEENEHFLNLNWLTQPDRALCFGKTFSLDNSVAVDEEELMAIFDKCERLVEKYGCVFKRDFNYGEWSGRYECSFYEKNGVGYLSFDLFNHFPTAVGYHLSKLFHDQEIGVCYHVEDWGGYLYVFKNGETAFEDSYDDDYDSEEESEEKPEVVKENPTSISFENFYQREERVERTPEELEAWRAERNKYWEGREWFNNNKDNLPKNEDGTYIITDDMPESAKEMALECNKTIIAKANEPTYEEVVAELGRDRITMDEMFKAVTWLQHHDYPRDNWHAIATRDMPILVKAHILFKRKRDEEDDKLWSEAMEKEQNQNLITAIDSDEFCDDGD